MTLPLSTTLILSEIESAMAILARWKQRIENGVPVIDLHAPDEALHDFLRELCGELVVVSGKCTTLTEVLYPGG